MNKKPIKIQGSASQMSLDGRMAHLEQTMKKLTTTVDNLAIATAKGFGESITKKHMENYPTIDDMEMMLSRHIGFFRKDYDDLTSRVKRLGVAVFKM